MREGLQHGRAISKGKGGEGALVSWMRETSGQGKQTLDTEVQETNQPIKKKTCIKEK